MLRGLQALETSSRDSPLKTHPRQRSIRKLFASLTTSPFGQALPYGEANVLNHAAWIFYLSELFRTEPAISSCLGTDSTSAWFSLIE